MIELSDFHTDVQCYMDITITTHGKICIMVFHYVIAIGYPFIMLMSVDRIKTHPIGLYY